MKQLLKKRLKGQRGFTLIELLAVIVILGILAAIAVPSIINIINNSKIDAHIANAQQMANSAKLYVNEQKTNITSTATTITLSDMIGDGLMDPIKDPSSSSGAGYDTTASVVNVSKDATSGIVSYKVTLVAAGTGGHTYINGTKDAFSLQRGDVSIP